MNDSILFHGGCHGCTMQTEGEGLGGCVGCRFFDFTAHSDLPDLNDSHLKEEDSHLKEENYMTKVRGEARALAAGLNNIPKEPKVSLGDQLDVAVGAENYEEAAIVRDKIAAEKPFKDALNAAIAKGDYEEASNIREKNKKGFFGKLGDYFKK